MDIGFTTGLAYKTHNPLSEEIISLCRRISLESIEINCVAGLDQKGLSVEQIRPLCLRPFKRLSLHAPCHDCRFKLNDQTEEILCRIQLLHALLQFEYVVFHPDLVDNWQIFRKYTFPVAIENMDIRKEFGQNDDDLQKVFDQIDCGLVIDLNHCFTVDPSMALAEKILLRFTDRLVGVHLSGYVGYHDPLFRTKQTDIIRRVPKIDIPITLESTFKDLSEAQQEYDYVKQLLG